MNKVLLSVKQRMARYLRNQGWVVFYLEPEHRKCDEVCCWLKLYEETEAREALESR